MRRFMAAGRAAWAARVLARSVSPPFGGTRRADRREQSAGTGLNELSECHMRLGICSVISRSSGGIGRPVAMSMFD